MLEADSACMKNKNTQRIKNKLFVLKSILHKLYKGITHCITHTYLNVSTDELAFFSQIPETRMMVQHGST